MRNHKTFIWPLHSSVRFTISAAHQSSVRVELFSQFSDHRIESDTLVSICAVNGFRRFSPWWLKVSSHRLSVSWTRTVPTRFSALYNTILTLYSFYYCRLHKHSYTLLHIHMLSRLLLLPSLYSFYHLFTCLNYFLFAVNFSNLYIYIFSFWFIIPYCCNFLV